MTQVYYYQERENSLLEGQNYIFFASPQELEKVIVPSCPGLPVPPSMFQCILDGHVKPD
jgi:hypothetical protein